MKYHKVTYYFIQFFNESNFYGGNVVLWMKNVFSTCDTKRFQSILLEYITFREKKDQVYLAFAMR